jgi:hypothetical protein
VVVIPWKLIGFLVAVGAAIAFDQYATNKELSELTEEDDEDDDDDE